MKWSLVLLLPAWSALSQNNFVQHNLVSDLAGMADFTDTNLVNPWGIAASGTSPFWLSDNHAGLSTLYNSSGVPQALTVNIPPPTGGTPPAAPTGIVFNGTTDFTVASNAVARFIFATEDGTIIGWNSGVNAVLKADNSASGAVYKGLALGRNGTSNYLYAANFHAGTVDVFDANYNPVTLAGSFADPALPAGFAPFNVQDIGGQLFVTYAKQDATGHHDVPGLGNGYINIFDTAGNLVQRLVSQGLLNSPWGLAKAPVGFGPFSGALLVGNFGNGHINAYDPASGVLLGTLADPLGSPITIQGLWGLMFGNGGNGGDAHTLYFSAGIPGPGAVEDHGLFGSLTALPATFTGVADQSPAENLTWAEGVAPFLLQRKANIADPNWLDVLTTSSRSAMVPKDAPASFFRVRSQATNSVLAFSVLLNGAAEVPPTASLGQGVGTLSLEGSNLTYFITFSSLSAPASAGHIHAPASTTANAGVIVPFSVPAATAGSFSGTVSLTMDQISNIVSGLAYVNIHTSVDPGGEIRGQIVPLHFPLTLNGAAEAPPVTTTATGSGSLTLIGSRLFYSISFSGLAGSATAAHIHGPAMPGVSAPVLVPLATPPSATSGSFSGSVSLVPTNLASLLSGQTYINIHSTVNPGGEIRGQLWPIQLSANFSGAAEVPTNSSAGTGTGFFTLTNGVLAYNVSFTNLSTNASAAHIHGPAAPGQNAGVIIPFSGVPAATSGSFSGTANPTSQQIWWMLTGLTYGNIHSALFPGGEIRGQLELNH